MQTVFIVEGGPRARRPREFIRDPARPGRKRPTLNVRGPVRPAEPHSSRRAVHRGIRDPRPGSKRINVNPQLRYSKQPRVRTTTRSTGRSVGQRRLAWLLYCRKSTAVNSGTTQSVWCRSSNEVEDRTGERETLREPAAAKARRGDRGKTPPASQGRGRLATQMAGAAALGRG